MFLIKVTTNEHTDYCNMITNMETLQQSQVPGLLRSTI